MIVNERERLILLYWNIGKLHLQKLLFYTITSSFVLVSNTYTVCTCTCDRT